MVALPPAHEAGYLGPKGMSTKPPFWSTAQPKPPATLSGTYAELRERAREQHAILRGYSKTWPFVVGDVISHPVHGTGIVVESPSPGKIKVLFADRARLMACGVARR